MYSHIIVQPTSGNFIHLEKLENFSLSILFPLNTTPTSFSPPAEPLATTFFPPSVSMILITKQLM